MRVVFDHPYRRHGHKEYRASYSFQRQIESVGGIHVTEGGGEEMIWILLYGQVRLETKDDYDQCLNGS